VLDRLNLAPKDAAALREFARQVADRLGGNLISLTLFGSKA